MKSIPIPAYIYLLTCAVFLFTNYLTSEAIAEISVETESGKIEINNGEIKIDGRDINDMNTNSSQSSSTTTSSSSSSGNSIQRSVNTVYLNSYKLSEPHLLKLETSGDLSGYVVLDGKIIKHINGGDFEIDLASYLSPGNHKLIIKLDSMSPNNSISLQLNTPGNSVNQNTSGNGTMEHIINLNVR